MLDVGSGPPLVLIPGIQGRWEWMYPAIDTLKDYCRVISFSLAGDRGSGRLLDPDRGFEGYLDQLEEVMAHVGLNNAAVCGVSFGGLIALHWAARRPECTQALILVSTPPPDWKPNSRAGWDLRAPRLLSPLFAAQSPFRLGPEIWRAFDSVGKRLAFTCRQLARIIVSPFSPMQMAQRLELVSVVDFETDCLQVTAPTLILTGEPLLDRVVPVNETLSYIGRIAMASHATIERTGHIGLVTRPKDFAEVVGPFVMRAASETTRHGV